MREISHLGGSIRKCCNQCGFANVWRPYQHYLAGAFPIDPIAYVPSARGLFCLLLGFELRESATEISSQLVRALVFGNDGEKLFQSLELLLRRLGTPVPFFDFIVFWREISRHAFLNALDQRCVLKKLLLGRMISQEACWGNPEGI
jgi:hypothetical protein